MVPATYNLPTGYRGDTYGPITFTFLDSSGSGINIDGFSGALQVREAAGYTPVIQWVTSDSGMLISGNTVTLTPKPGDCMQALPGTYSYDLQLNSGSYVRTYTRGEFVLESDITSL